MIDHLSHVMTLANSIIGVSVLAMPFCFKQCGIVLAILVLLISSVLSRLACHFLIKSAVMSRRRNFEILAFHAFGKTGKFFVELFIIGFLLGTCIAFFVVVGDLGPQIIGKMLNKQPEDIRTSVLVTMGFFIVLPLGLLRNIDSLSSVCTATIGFYLCLVFKVICESTRHILLGDWYDSVIYWRPAGILQCLPIFSMALFCQTQLFEIYEAIPNVCLEKMNQVVRGALNICTAVYLCVGFFGYVAFCSQPFTGNILMSFEPSLTSDVIKMGFVFSVAFSFPLVIFPCRASLDSLLFRKAHGHEPTINYIPEVRFRWLTLAIVAVSLGTGILIPNIEFILGIVGSTIGVMICLIFPAAFFIAISTKNTNERLVAQAILFFGLWIMVLGTYANIYAMEDSSNSRIFITTGKPVHEQLPKEIVPPFDKILEQDFPIDKKTLRIHRVKEKPGTVEEKMNDLSKISEIGRAPAISVDDDRATETAATKKIDPPSLARPQKHYSADEKNNDDKRAEEKMKPDDKLSAAVADKPSLSSALAIDKKLANLRTGENSTKNEKQQQQKNENLIDSDAIKKEESELAAAADLEAEARHEKLRQTLEKHKLEQLEMMEEQKEILKDLEEKKEEFALEKKRLANERTRKNDNGVGVGKEEREIHKNSVVVREKDDKTIIEAKNGDSNRESNSLASINVDNQQESRGPVLNALTNWTADKNGEKKNARSPSDEKRPEVAAEASKSIDLPIALRMSGDKTNKLPARDDDKLSSSNNASVVDENLAIGRDILEHRDDYFARKREKRENNDEFAADEDKTMANVKIFSVDDKSCDNRGNHDYSNDSPKNDGTRRKMADNEATREAGNFAPNNSSTS